MNNLKEIENQIYELKKNAKQIDMKIKELEEMQLRHLEIEDLEKSIMYSLIHKYKPLITVKTDFCIDYDKPRKSGIQKTQLKWTDDDYKFSEFYTEEIDTEESDTEEINTVEIELTPNIHNIETMVSDDYKTHLKYYDEFINNYKK